MKNTVNTIIAISLALYSIATSAQRTDPKNQDKELGAISWYRDYSTALQLSKEYNKPVLILFQEVPGCATCRNYGHDVLSN
ncbi:MAG: thioredoxin family (seleno)protein, partial [Nonlabens ulvanivorans]